MIITRTFVEDSFKRVFVGAFMPKPITIIGKTRLNNDISPCITCLQLKPNSEFIELKGCNRMYDANTGDIVLILPTFYVSDPIKKCKEQGFSTIIKVAENGACEVMP